MKHFPCSSSNFRFAGWVVCIFVLTAFSYADSLRIVSMGRTEFVREALRLEPKFQETRMSSFSKEQKVEAIKAGAILPKFEISSLVGVVPGLKKSLSGLDTVETWDFSKIGPYFGLKINAAQPLNYGQLQIGLSAAKADLQQKKMEIEGKELSKAVEFFSYYYGYLLATEMSKLAQDAHKQIHRAADEMEEALDEEKEGVSQMDLLELKAGFFEIDNAVLDAKSGLKKAELAIRFALCLQDNEKFFPQDSSLYAIDDFIPSLDSLIKFALAEHPDVRRLTAGLEATRLQQEVAFGKMAPEFFLLGELEYAKSWAGDRTRLSRNAFAQDPVNTISGALGIGVRYRLNFWNQFESYRNARFEHRLLKQTESYAYQGIKLQIEEKYEDYITAKSKLESVRAALRATEGMLKGAALQYDINPGKSASLLANAYKKNVLMKKDYYFTVYNYNISVARLFAQAGMSLANGK